MFLRTLEAGGDSADPILGVGGLSGPSSVSE